MFVARPESYVSARRAIFYPSQSVIREIASVIRTDESHLEGFLSIQKRLVEREIPALAAIDVTGLDYSVPIIARSYWIPEFVAKFWLYDRSPHTWFNILYCATQ